ncbi:MAG: hypothetical protein R3E97_11670 [Candidatus Eisenbacteria bacterium]
MRARFLTLVAALGTLVLSACDDDEVVGPDPTGACCQMGAVCYVWTQAECNTFGGVYQGDDTECDPNPCPTTGACCDSAGDCTIVFESDCTDGGGTFKGESTICDPNPCLVPDFSAPDMNSTSARFGESVSPRDYLQKVSAWYFGHAT